VVEKGRYMDNIELLKKLDVDQLQELKKRIKIENFRPGKSSP
jgi:hypothetical protein